MYRLDYRKCWEDLKDKVMNIYAVNEKKLADELRTIITEIEKKQEPDEIWGA